MRALGAAFLLPLALAGAGAPSRAPGAEPLPNLNDLPSDLEVPAVTKGEPAPGRRVWQTAPGYEGWNVAHALYLPAEWKAEGVYPVIFEYPGNGGFKNSLGDTCDGTVGSCCLGYGLSGGSGYIWVSLPFVDPQSKSHTLTWWGDADETARYCRAAVAQVCQRHGGDARRLVLAGFSRGAIACNYIGLRDDETAKLWRAFVIHSHYDGVRTWNYAHSDAASARRRLARLEGRPQFISHERSTQGVEDFLRESPPPERFTFATLPFSNHSANWALKDIPLRKTAREWLAQALAE